MAEPPRIGLVLGAGGVAGGAFHAAVLAALHQVTGWDPRRAAVIVGTSAGSVTGTSLRAGLSAADLLARAEGRPLSPEGARLLAQVGPPVRPPALRLAGQRRPPRDVAARLARAAARPFEARPMALLASLMAEGTVDTSLISSSVAAMFPHAWPDDPLWICAVRQRDGRLAVFGRDAKPAVGDAVAASCAIPRFFRPVTIDGDDYVDGGVHSPTNADLVAPLGLDLVVVSSPMSLAGRPRRLTLDQPVRRWSRLLLDTEAVRLRRAGVPVVAFQPTAEDVDVIGPNAMDANRRAAVARQAHRSTLQRLQRPDVLERLAALST